MNLVVDKNIYSDSVISKVVYWLSSEYIIKRRSESNFENIEINVDNKNAEKIETKFFQLLNDYKLREVIAQETREIKTILYAKAFADDEDFSEEDITD